jgi:biotin operon repressor
LGISKGKAEGFRKIRRITILTNTQNRAIMLCECLKNNHTGRENAASSKILEAAFDMDGRTIRRCINMLRQEGVPICSDTSGYYYAASQQEINETISRLNSLITKVSNAKNGLLTAHCSSKSHIPISIEIKISVG